MWLRSSINNSLLNWYFEETQRNGLKSRNLHINDKILHLIPLQRTWFETISKYVSHLNFGIFNRLSAVLKVTSLVWSQVSGFQKLAKMDHFFNELFSTQNVNVARFARNVECDFFCNFQNYTGLALVPILQWRHETENEWRPQRCAR